MEAAVVTTPVRAPVTGERQVSTWRDPILLGSLAVAFAVRIGFAIPPHVCFGDESCYLFLAKNLFSGAGFTYYNGTPETHFPPLFPIVLGLLNLVVGNWEVVSLVVYVICCGLLPLPVYALGRDMYGLRVGRWAAFLTAILPALTTGVLFAETMSEPLFLLCLCTGACFLWKTAVNRKLVHAAAAGAGYCLAYLTRPEGIVFTAVAFVFLGLLGVLRRGRFRSLLLPSSTMLVAFFVVASPYLYFLHGHTGTWALTTKSTTSYTTTRGLVDHDGEKFQRDTWGLNARGEVHYFAHDYSRSLGELLRGEYRDRVISDVRKNLATAYQYLQRPWVLGRWLELLAVVGLAGSLLLWKKREPALLGVLHCSALASVLIFFINERFLYGLLLPLTLWAACGLELIFRGCERWWPPRLPFLRPAALQWVVAIGFAVYYGRHSWLHFQTKQAERAEVWMTAEWLKANTPPDAVILTPSPELSLHADRGWLPLPVADREQVVRYARRGPIQGTHVCLRGRYLIRRPEQRVDLFRRARTDEHLELLVRVGENANFPSFVVYRILPAPK